MRNAATMSMLRVFSGVGVGTKTSMSCSWLGVYRAFTSAQCTPLLFLSTHLWAVALALVVEVSRRREGLPLQWEALLLLHLSLRPQYRSQTRSQPSAPASRAGFGCELPNELLPMLPPLLVLAAVLPARPLHLWLPVGGRLADPGRCHPLGRVLAQPQRSCWLSRRVGSFLSAELPAFNAAFSCRFWALASSVARLVASAAISLAVALLFVPGIPGVVDLT